MQLNIPTPYVIQPINRIPKITALDVSLNKLIEHKMRQSQQDAIIKRTPTVLTDPLFNNRVRDYYRNKYEQSLGAEVTGRLMGAGEGALTGAGIGATIAGLAAFIGALFTPVPGDEIAAGASLVTSFAAASAAAKTGAGIGAGIGAGVGLLQSDYSTYYATRDMFSNLYRNQSVGRGVLNTLSFVGSSMDLAGTSAVVKSSIYALINDKSVLDTIAKSYGLSEEGRTEIDYSDIRESLGIDLGGVGNFMFDMTGEMLSDFGAVAGIGSSIMKGNRVYTKIIAENTYDIINKSTFKGSMKQLIKHIQNNEIDDIILMMKQNNPKLALTEELTKAVQKYVDKINNAAFKKVSVRISAAWRGYDEMDDFLTGVLWKLGNPYIAGIHGVKKIKELNLIPKLAYMISDDAGEFIDKVGSFSLGNSFRENKLRKSISKKDLATAMTGYSKEFSQALSNKKYGSRIIDKYVNNIFPEDSELFVVNRKNMKDKYRAMGWDDITKLYEDSKTNDEAKALWDALVKDVEDGYAKVKAEEDILIKRKENWRKRYEETVDNTKVTFEERQEALKKLDEEKLKIEEDTAKLFNNTDYRHYNYSKTIMSDPEGFVLVNEVSSKLHSIRVKSKYLKVGEAQINDLNNSFAKLIKKYMEADPLDETNIVVKYFNTYSKYKSNRETLEKFINSEIKADLTKFFTTKESEFINNATKHSTKFQMQYTRMLYNRLLKIGDDALKKELAELEIKHITKENSKEVLSKLQSLQNKYDIKIEIPKESKTMKMLEEFEQARRLYYTRKNQIGYLVNDVDKRHSEIIAIGKLYTIDLTNQSKIAADQAKLQEAIMNMLDIDIEQVKEDISKLGFMDYFSILDDNDVYSINNFLIHINDICDAIYFVKPDTARISRIIHRLIPKWFDALSKANGVSNEITDNIKKTITKEIEKTNKVLKSTSLKSFIDSINKILDGNYSISEVKDMISELQRKQITLAFKDLFKNKEYKSVIKTLTSLQMKMNDQKARIISQIEKRINEINSDIIDKSIVTDEEYYDYLVMVDALKDTLNKEYDKYADKRIKHIYNILNNKTVISDKQYNILNDELDVLEFIYEHPLKSTVDEYINKYSNLYTTATNKFEKESYKRILDTIKKYKKNNNFKDMRGEISYSNLNRSYISESINKIKEIKSRFIDETNYKAYVLTLNSLEKMKGLDTKSLRDSISETFLKIKQSIPEKEYAQLQDELNLLNRCIYNLETDSLPLDDVAKLPLKIKESLTTKYLKTKHIYDSIFNLATKYDNLDFGYQSLHKYVYDMGYNIEDIVDEALSKYIHDLKKGFASIDGDINKEIGNEFFSNRRFLNILNIASFDNPVYKKFIKIVESFNSTNRIKYPNFLKHLEALDNYNKRMLYIKKLGINVISDYDASKFKVRIKHPVIRFNKILQRFLKDDVFKGPLEVSILKDKLKALSMDFIKDRDSLEELRSVDFKTYKALLGDEEPAKLTDEELAEKLLNKLIAARFSKIENSFVDLYQGRNLSSFIHKSKSYSNSKITSRDYIIFDSETTGDTSNGMYSIFARRIHWDKSTKEWVVVEEQQFALDPKYVDSAKWTIDDVVDQLNSNNRNRFKGSTRDKINKLAKETDPRFVFSSDKELANAFVEWINNSYKTKGNVSLVAHNARFDFSQFVNTITGEQVDAKGAEMWASQYLDFDIIDSGLMQSYMGIFGNSRFATNEDLGKMFVNVREIYEESDGTEKVLEHFTDGIEDVLEIRHKADGKKVVTFNGGDLHEAYNDINLMTKWFTGGLNRMEELGLDYSTLDSSYGFMDKALTVMLNKKLNANIKKQLRELLSILPESDTGADFVGRLHEAIRVILDDSNDYATRIRYINELEDITSSKSYQDYFRDSDVNDFYLDKVSFKSLIEDLQQLDRDVTNSIEIFKQFRGSNTIGYLQNNTSYVNFVIANMFSSDSMVTQLVDLFNNNKYGTIKNSDFVQFAKNLDAFIATGDPASAGLKYIRDNLEAMQTSMEWYTNFINDVPPQYYDVMDNIIRKIDKYKNQGLSDDEIHNLISDYLYSRIKSNNLDHGIARSLYTQIRNNFDKVKVPSKDYINKIYRHIKDDLMIYLNGIKKDSKRPEEVLKIEELENIIDTAISNMRSVLTVFKSQNDMLRKMPLTLQELNKISEITEEQVDSIRNTSPSAFNTFRGNEIQFEDGIHRITPAEAISWRSRYTVKFNDEYRFANDLKHKINEMNSKNFIPRDDYKALPFTTFDNNRISQMYHLAAEALGISDEELIDTFYNSSAYKYFNKQHYMDLYNWLLGHASEEYFNELGIDYMKFTQFVKAMAEIRDDGFDYLKSGYVLRDNIISAAMHSLLYGSNAKLQGRVLFKDNEDVLSKVKVIQSQPFYKEGYQKSLSLFDDVKAMFTRLDGSVDSEAFKKYLRNHPEYVLTYMDDAGKMHRLNEFNDRVINDVLTMDNVPFSIMSKDLYIRMTNQLQRIKIKNPIFKWLHDYALRPIKMLQLGNLSYMFSNTVTALFQNMISDEGKINMPKAIKNTVEAFRDYHRYNDLLFSITSNKYASELLGSNFYTISKRWVELLDNEDFLFKLKLENDPLFDTLSKLTKEDITMLKDLNEIVNTAAAYGEINSVTRHTALEEQFSKESEEASKKLKDKYPGMFADIDKPDFKYKTRADLLKQGFDESEINDIMQLQVISKRRKYQVMPIEELENKLKELEDKEKFAGRLYGFEYREKYIIQDAIQFKKEKDASKINVLYLLQKYLDMNGQMETAFRIAAMRNYIETGMSFDQATAEVIKRQFIYNNKSELEQYAEFIIPFISYPLRMISLVEDMTKDSTTMDLIFRFNELSWGDEDAERSDYLMKRKARGDIPVGNKLFNLGNPFTEGLVNIQNPMYALNNKLNPLLKPITDEITGSQYKRWNQLPLISNVNGVVNIVSQGNLLANMTSDYYGQSNYVNYYRPRYNNRIGGTLYNKLYTKTGFSRMMLNMKPLSMSNLKYRVNDIMKYSGPYKSR